MGDDGQATHRTEERVMVAFTEMKEEKGLKGAKRTSA